jgi:hypothetical protein
MVERIEDIPDGVVGLRASDKLTKDELPRRPRARTE